MEPDSGTYLGWDLRDGPLVVRPHSSFYFSDLRGATLTDQNLTGIRLIGCRLNGASFNGSNLAGARFESCFAGDDGPPVNFAGCRLQETEFVDCHLHHRGADLPQTLLSWPESVAAAASRTLANRNDDRFAGVKELRQIADCRSLPILGFLLVDDEWEVTAQAIEAIAELRDCIKPEWRSQLMYLVFTNLGSEWSVLKETTSEQLAVLKPTDEMLANVLEMIADADDRRKLTGLRAAVALCGADRWYCALVPVDAVYEARSTGPIKTRLAAVRVIGLLDDPRSELENAISDPSPDVRQSALQEMTGLSKPPAREVLVPLLNDQADEVRVEALDTMNLLGILTEHDVAAASTDPSVKVRRAAESIRSGER
jgi:hypothetical protein